MKIKRKRRDETFLVKIDSARLLEQQIAGEDKRLLFPACFISRFRPQSVMFLHSTFQQSLSYDRNRSSVGFDVFCSFLLRHFPTLQTTTTTSYYLQHNRT